MHILGKVFTWLIALAAVGAMVLTAKTLQVRSSWMRKAQQAQEDYEKLAPQLDESRRKLDDLRGELARTMLPWDRYWDGVECTFDQTSGQVTVGLGTLNGLAEQQRLYAFQPRPEGGYSYVGPYLATTVRENQALLTPAFRVRPADLQAMRAGEWRLRAMIPPSYSARFTALEVRLTEADELLARQQTDLSEQTALVDAAQAHLDRRSQELVGGPLLPTDPELPPEFREGLIPVTNREQESRNAVLVEIDRLRHLLRDLRDEFLKLQADNEALARSLPQPTASTGTISRISSGNE